ncbi:MAG: IS66 family insertion sequence element accessory protein TnpA [Janthinobacterium lividum]
MRHDREYWRRHVLAHRQTGSTQASYCLRHGLHPKTYRSWHRRLKTDGDLVPRPAGEGGANRWATVASLVERPSSTESSRMRGCATV